MKVIKPITIGDAQLISSSLSATSAPTWSASVSYAQDTFAQSGRLLYKSLQGSNLGHDPTLDSSADWWVDAGPTNRWAMFDSEINTQSIVSAAVGQDVSMSVTLAPGSVNSIAALELIGNSLNVEVRDGTSALVYEKTISLDVAVINDWYAYFFEPDARLSLVSLQDLPPYLSAQIKVTLSGKTEVRMGSLVVGNLYSIGDTRYGGNVGINDFSKKSTNDFGVTTLVKRAFSKRANFNVMVDSDNLDRVYRLLSELRSTNALWVGIDEARYTPTVIFGFYKEFSIDLALSKTNYCSISIEGMI
jgi:hypothetical protein